MKLSFLDETQKVKGDKKSKEQQNKQILQNWHPDTRHQLLPNWALQPYGYRACARANCAIRYLLHRPMYSNPEFDEAIRVLHLTREEKTRVKMIRALTRQMLDEAPYIWLPTGYVHSAWWPWVKNYAGELRVGAVRPGPIYARIWIDEAMKREMGFD